MAVLSAADRRKIPAKEFGQPKKLGFPMEDKTHDRMAISGATRSYNAGNISKSEEERIQAEARRKLGDKGGATGDSTKPVQKEQVHGSPLRKGKRKAIAATMEQDGGGAAQPKGSPMAWRGR